MRRIGYVDDKGDKIDLKFESKKIFIKMLFVIQVIVPIILICLIVYISSNNIQINKIYKNIEKATTKYLSDNALYPVEPSATTEIKLKNLYENNYLSTVQTDDLSCTGTVKITKIDQKNKKYVYTYDLKSCGKYNTNKWYNGWSNETSIYPNKSVVDVIPYYNYQNREINTTSWSYYFDKEKLTKEEKGVNIPEGERDMPELPENVTVIKINVESKTYYRHSTATWKWYDKKGDYSNDFYSEKPSGYQYKDEDTKIYSSWSDYSLNYPAEKEYREIQTITGYKFYYIDEASNKKKYYNNGEYSVRENVDTSIYKNTEQKSMKMYRYRDKMWRWYNGIKRNYGTFSSRANSIYKYKDAKVVPLSGEINWSTWDDESSITKENKAYTSEETKQMYRFQYVYEILSDPIYEKKVDQKTILKDTETTLDKLYLDETKKIETTYKYKYRK